MAIPMPARCLLEILLDVGDDPVGAAFRLERSAHLIIRVRLRSRELIEGLIHEKNRAVPSSAEIQIIEHAGRPGISTAEFKAVPINSMLFDGNAGNDRGHR